MASDFDLVGRAKQAVAWLKQQWAELVEWLGPVADSIRGRINLEELIRVVVLALTNGGLAALLQAIAAASGAIFVDQDVAREVSLGIMILTAVLDYWRRRGHGPLPLTPPSEPHP